MTQKKSLDLEIKVGLFVTAGVALILIAILFLGGADTWIVRQVHYPLHFQSVEGLLPGAKVVLGGINIGEVDTVDFDPKTRDINVKLNVNKKYAIWIREDTEAEIATQGMLGDKYISLNAGSEGAKIIEPNTPIKTKPLQDLSQMVSKGDTLMVNLNQIASTLERLLKSFEHGNRNDIFFQGMASSAKNLSEASNKLNKELDQLKLRSSIGHLHDILEKINNGTGTMGALVNDPQLYYDLRSLMGGANRNRVVRNLVRQTVKEGDTKKEKKK
jgi:phospholipid/cholesterol/gamma-HCH transport system substrate-binding protein